MKGILIGSRAYNFFNNIPQNSTSDWDFIHPNITTHQSCDFLDYNEKTNRIILEYLNSSTNKQIITSPIGDVIVCPLPILKVLYLSSLPLKNLKYEEKLKNLTNIHLNSFLKELLKERLIETNKRIELFKFFGDSINRVFNHDDLHQWILSKNETLCIKRY